MDLIDLLYIALFALLFKSKHTRLASKVFVLCSILFLVMYNILPNGSTYGSSGLANCIIFWVLVNSNGKVYILVSLLSICLIFVNIQGYINYNLELEATEYNNTYFILLNIQLALLYMKAAINGLIDRFNFKRDLVQLLIDSNMDAFEEFIQSEKKEAEK